jgi:MFS family permease
MAVSAAAGARSRGMTGEEKKVIFASSLGTVFEWYDFYLYGSLAAFIGATFFSAAIPESTRNIFALLAFAAGFLVRPFGALVFGRLGDLVGRKYTFLVTMAIMGLSTFLVGVLPGYASIGILAPVSLIFLRMLQGLALGGEYGGAATYVAEHSPNDRKRGYYTSWIQTTATLGLFLSLLVILGIQTMMTARRISQPGVGVFRSLSRFLLLLVSIWIRLQLSESPTFQKMKEEGKTSKAPLKEAFGTVEERQDCAFRAVRPHSWPSRCLVHRTVLRAVLPAERAQGRWLTTNIMIATSLAIGTLFFVVLRLAVGQDRPQADHHGWPGAGDLHLLPAVQGADLGCQPGAGDRRRKT